MPRSAATRAAAENSRRRARAAPGRAGSARSPRPSLRSGGRDPGSRARAPRVTRAAAPRSRPGSATRPVARRQEERQVDELEAEELHDPDPLVLPRDRRERVLAAGDARAAQAPTRAPVAAEPTRRAYFASTPGRVTRRWVLDAGEPRGDLLVRQLDVQAVRLGIDLDHVAVAKDRERAAVGRLRRDVPDRDPLCAAAEAAVGEKGHLVGEPGADDRRGEVRHLRHPRPALRALVAQDDDVAGLRCGRRRPRGRRPARRRRPWPGRGGGSRSGSRP